MRRVLAVLLAGLALGAPTAALAQQQSSASADELWRRYALDSQGSAATPQRPTTTTSRPPSTAAAPAAPRRQATAPSSNGEDGSSRPALPIVLALAALAATCAQAALLLRRWQGRPAGAEAPPADAAPKPPPARSAPRAVSPFADASQEAHVPGPPTPTPGDHEAALPPDRDVGWTTEITWQQSEGRCRFAAVAVRPDGDDAVTVARSAWLGWPPSERSPVGALGEAVRGLERALEDAGWSALEPGTAWYAKRFAWTPAGDRAAAEALAPIIDLPMSAEEVELEPFARRPYAAPSRDPAPARPAKDPDLPRDAVPYRDGSAGAALRRPPGHRDPAPAVPAANGGDGQRSMADGPPAVAPVRHCAIRFARLAGRARFLVVTVLADSTNRVVARSREFPVSGDGSVPHEGPARDAFAKLLERLQAAGWVRVETGGAWYEAELVKACDVEYELAVVSCWRGKRRAQFFAFLLDDFGMYAQSPFFGLHASEPLEPSGSSQDVHHTLLRALRDDGWQVTGTAGEWYATTLRRRLEQGPR